MLYDLPPHSNDVPQTVTSKVVTGTSFKTINSNVYLHPLANVIE